MSGLKDESGTMSTFKFNCTLINLHLAAILTVHMLTLAAEFGALAV